MKRMTQRGFTMIELALAGAVLGGIVAALLPAVQ